MAEPNPDDGLMADITKEYRENKSLFLKKAQSSTKLHAAAVKQLRPVVAQASKTAEVVAEAAGSESSSDCDSGDEGIVDDEKENTNSPLRKRPKTENQEAY